LIANGAALRIQFLIGLSLERDGHQKSPIFRHATDYNYQTYSSAFLGRVEIQLSYRKVSIEKEVKNRLFLQFFPNGKAYLFQGVWIISIPFTPHPKSGYMWPPYPGICTT
jgi:hypothetical protein